MERANHRVTADTVICEEGEIVLIRRKREPFRHRWAIPGGHLEDGEQVDEAAVREVKEETGLDVELDGILGIYDEPGRDPRGHVISVVYTATPNSGALQPSTDAEEAAWFDLEEIPEELAFDHSTILADFKTTASSI